MGFGPRYSDMTHVQKFWKADAFVKSDPSLKEKNVSELRTWIQHHRNLPNILTDEQILLFYHSCYYNMEDTKKCIEDYYKLRTKVPQFFEERDVQSEALQKALQVLHFGIFPRKTPENYQIVYHKLNNTDPSNYVFNDGFKLLVMLIDSVYAKEGPLPGLQMLFDLNGVKLGHVTRVPLNSVKKCLEYIQTYREGWIENILLQFVKLKFFIKKHGFDGFVGVTWFHPFERYLRWDAIPVRLKGIHVLNVHPVIDKIMLLIRPFLRKNFLRLIHFYRENDQEIYKVIPKSCLPKDYGGELESIQYYHEEFIREMKQMRPLFLEEEELIFKNTKKTKAKLFGHFDLSSLEID